MKKFLAVLCAIMMLCTAAALAENVKMGHVIAAIHGTACFGEVTVAVQDDVIVGVYIDEYQYMDPTAEGVVPVPNSEGMAASVAEGKVLASKRESTAYYSNAMASRAGSTVAIDANYDAIQEFCVGKTVAELKEAVEGKEAAEVIDAVTGATLADTPNYIAAVIAAAEAAK